MNPTSLNPALAPSTQSLRAGAAPVARPADPAAGAPQRAADSVELSTEARRSGEAPVRLDLVQRVREQIARGTYDTLDKIVIAAEGLRRDASLVA